MLRLGEPRSNFDVWKFPQVCVHDPGGPLADEKASVSLDDKRDEMACGGGGAPAKVWQFSRTIFPESDAKFFHRADRALWISRGANQRAEFHEGLVEVRARGPFLVLVLRSRSRPRIVGGSVSHQFFCQPPELRVGFLFARIFCNAENPRQYADDIAVKNWRRLVERDAANRAAGVTPDSRQRDHVVKIIREFAIMLFHDLPRGFLQVPDAGVIAKTLPKLVDFVRTGIGCSFNGREFLHPAFPIRNHGFDLGLLEHDFGNPDGVGIARVPPRQVAGVPGKPIQQKPGKLLQF